jgi:hypothetical protein
MYIDSLVHALQLVDIESESSGAQGVKKIIFSGLEILATRTQCLFNVKKWNRGSVSIQTLNSRHSIVDVRVNDFRANLVEQR